jgi:zinc transport system ATP-binding protein
MSGGIGDGPATGGPVLSFAGVCFAYGTSEALHNVTFDVPERSLVAVVGPNGGGKTTLLRLILGLERPLYGAVRVFGRPPESARRRVGYVPQVLAYDTHFPVNVNDVVLMGTLGGGLAGAYGRPERQAAAAALERVGLAGLERRPFAELSGGERQRTLIAQALAGGPQLLLLDEPTASVDPPTADRLHDLFGQLAETLTVLFVSHNLSVVTARATHVLCVNRTADLHPASDVVSETFRAAYGGGRMVMLQHGASCQVVDASAALTSPHHHCGDAGCSQEVEP